MRSSIIILLVFLFSNFFFNQILSQRPSPPEFCQEFYPFCDGGQELTHVDQNDIIDVYYMQAPLFEAKYGPMLGVFNLYHTAVGFQNRNTGANWTVEFDAMFEVGNATLPYIVDDQVVWCNAGASCSYTSIDYPYFSSISYMTTINGSIFNNWWDWVVSANSSYTTYELFNVFDTWDNGNGNLYIHSLTCADFAWLMFGELQSLGAQFDPAITPKHDFINLYSETPIPVNASDPKWAAEILNFYKGVQWANASSDVERMEIFIRFLVSDKFVLSHGNYYYLKMKYPFFGLHYWQQDFPNPSSTNSEAEQKEEMIKSLVDKLTYKKPKVSKTQITKN